MSHFHGAARTSLPVYLLLDRFRLAQIRIRVRHAPTGLADELRGVHERLELFDINLTGAAGQRAQLVFITTRLLRFTSHVLLL